MEDYNHTSAEGSASHQTSLDVRDSISSQKSTLHRHAITDVERKDLRAHKRALMQKNGKWTTNQMNEFFKEKYGRVLPQASVSRTLSAQYDYLDKDDHPPQSAAKRGRPPQWLDLDIPVFDWEQQMLQKGKVVTGEDIKRMASKIFSVLPQYYGIEPPKFSSGWLDSYKARCETKMCYYHDESGAVDLAVAETEFDSIRKDLYRYGSEDNIYIMDETALFWKLSPDNVPMNRNPATVKSEKAMISVGLACNITGTHKLEPWVIGKAQTPRCFSRSAVHIDNLPIVWQSNGKAWVSGVVFAEYLTWFDSQMAGRKVCLLVDSFSAHTAGIQFVPPKHLQNTQIHILPTSYIPISHPMVQGIVRSWKAHYRRRWLAYIHNRYDTGGNPMTSMNVLQAIRWGVAAWEDVTPTTIRNAWIGSNVIEREGRPMDEDGDEDKDEDEEWQNAVIKDNRLFDSMMAIMEQQIKDLERRNRIQSAMHIGTFINPPHEIVDDLVDDDDFEGSFMEIYGPGAVQREYETDEEDVTVDQIGEDTALKLLAGLRLYEEQQADGDKTFVAQLNKQERKILARKTKRKRSTSNMG